MALTVVATNESLELTEREGLIVDKNIAFKISRHALGRIGQDVE